MTINRPDWSLMGLDLQSSGYHPTAGSLTFTWNHLGFLHCPFNSSQRFQSYRLLVSSSNCYSKYRLGTTNPGRSPELSKRKGSVRHDVCISRVDTLSCSTCACVFACAYGQAGIRKEKGKKKKKTGVYNNVAALCNEKHLPIWHHLPRLAYF